MLVGFGLQAQEVGYNIGISSQGINPIGSQPLYGMSIGGRFSRLFSLETNLIYSQRQIGENIQADYLSFMLMPKFGYFTDKIGLFVAPSFNLNPCLYHSNINNHTYVSAMACVGAQIGIGKKIIVDAKLGFDQGLSGAYFDPQTSNWQKYKGPMLMLGMKLNMGPVKNMD